MLSEGMQPHQIEQYNVFCARDANTARNIASADLCWEPTSHSMQWQDKFGNRYSYLRHCQELGYFRRHSGPINIFLFPTWDENRELRELQSIARHMSARLINVVLPNKKWLIEHQGMTFYRDRLEPPGKFYMS